MVPMVRSRLVGSTHGGVRLQRLRLMDVTGGESAAPTLVVSISGGQDIQATATPA